ncbi:MAG: hypothetical protein K8R92_06345 [Planctomycetes bacterium]|nr:hypothetical protein [Planctomycetota bacterium]
MQFAKLLVALPLMSLLCGRAAAQNTGETQDHSGHSHAPAAGSAPSSGTATGAAQTESPALDPLRDAGVPQGERIAAISAKAKSASTSLAAATLAEIEACDACLGRNDLTMILAAQPVADLKALAPTLVAKAKDSPSRIVKAACIRALFMLPESDRPSEAASWKPVVLKTTTVPGKMAWDPKEFTVSHDAVVAVVMTNPDSMQHNLLVCTPGSLSEIGVAADKLGEGAIGKQRQYVPDSPKVLEIMGLTAPNTTGELWFIAPTKPGTYPLICTYPGHWRMMNGKLKVQ